MAVRPLKSEPLMPLSESGSFIAIGFWAATWLPGLAFAAWRMERLMRASRWPRALLEPIAVLSAPSWRLACMHSPTRSATLRPTAPRPLEHAMVRRAGRRAIRLQRGLSLGNLATRNSTPQGKPLVDCLSPWVTLSHRADAWLAHGATHGLRRQLADAPPCPAQHPGHHGGLHKP